MKLVIVDGCPCPASIAPYVEAVLNRAGQTANSIYRGEDAKALLHKYGKHTQAEIHRMYPSISNPPGLSSHELRGDGVTAARGAKLPEWKVGVDSGSDSNASREAITRAARELGYTVEHPYSRGVEAHHWNFKYKPTGLTSDPVLKLGRIGPSVIKLKKLLYAKGVRNFSGKDSNNRYIPYYGKYTKEAVQRFQRAHGLTSDGIVGASTWRVLRK